MFFPITFLLAILAYVLPWTLALNHDADAFTIGLLVVLSLITGSILIAFPLTAWAAHANDLGILRNEQANINAHRLKLENMKLFLNTHKFPSPARLGKNLDEPTNVVVNAVLTLEREYLRAQEIQNDA